MIWRNLKIQYLNLFFGLAAFIVAPSSPIFSEEIDAQFEARMKSEPMEVLADLVDASNPSEVLRKISLDRSDPKQARVRNFLRSKYGARDTLKNAYKDFPERMKKLPGIRKIIDPEGVLREYAAKNGSSTPDDKIFLFELQMEYQPEKTIREYLEHLPEAERVLPDPGAKSEVVAIMGRWIKYHYDGHPENLLAKYDQAFRYSIGVVPRMGAVKEQMATLGVHILTHALRNNPQYFKTEVADKFQRAVQRDINAWLHTEWKPEYLDLIPKELRQIVLDGLSSGAIKPSEDVKSSDEEFRTFEAENKLKARRLTFYKRLEKISAEMAKTESFPVANSTDGYWIDYFGGRSEVYPYLQKVNPEVYNNLKIQAQLNKKSETENVEKSPSTEVAPSVSAAPPVRITVEQPAQKNIIPKNDNSPIVIIAASEKSEPSLEETSPVEVEIQKPLPPAQVQQDEQKLESIKPKPIALDPKLVERREARDAQYLQEAVAILRDYLTSLPIELRVVPSINSPDKRAAAVASAIRHQSIVDILKAFPEDFRFTIGMKPNKFEPTENQNLEDLGVHFLIYRLQNDADFFRRTPEAAMDKALITWFRTRFKVKESAPDALPQELSKLPKNFLQIVKKGIEIQRALLLELAAGSEQSEGHVLRRIVWNIDHPSQQWKGPNFKAVQAQKKATSADQMKKEIEALQERLGTEPLVVVEEFIRAQDEDARTLPDSISKSLAARTIGEWIEKNSTQQQVLNKMPEDLRYSIGVAPTLQKTRAQLSEVGIHVLIYLLRQNPEFFETGLASRVGRAVVDWIEFEWDPSYVTKVPKNIAALIPDIQEAPEEIEEVASEPESVPQKKVEKKSPKKTPKKIPDISEKDDIDDSVLAEEFIELVDKDLEQGEETSDSDAATDSKFVEVFKDFRKNKKSSERPRQTEKTKLTAEEEFQQDWDNKSLAQRIETAIETSIQIGRIPSDKETSYSNRVIGDWIAFREGAKKFYKKYEARLSQSPGIRRQMSTGSCAAAVDAFANATAKKQRNRR